MITTWLRPGGVMGAIGPGTPPAARHNSRSTLCDCHARRASGHEIMETQVAARLWARPRATTVGGLPMTSQVSQQSTELTLTGYPGDGAGLLAFDLDQSMQEDLAGFAVTYTDPDGQTFPVLNRLSFAQAITSATTPEQRVWTPTSQAPLQKFHWVHFPPDVKPGTFTYTA